MTNPAGTGLVINCKTIPLGVWVSPRAEINGHPVTLNWGVNHVPAPPGVHNIRIHMPWLFKYGKAEITVDNTVAPAPPVFYAVPYTTFSKGAIGLAPVKNPGLGAFLAVIILPLLLIALCCVGAALMGGS